MSGTNSPQGGLTRRSFLKTTAAVAGATALAGGAGLTALAADEANDSGEEQVFSGACVANCNGHCRLNVTVREGKVVKTSRASLPDPEYDRACLRGMSQVQRIYGPYRLKYPLRRVGERGAGEWERISWDAAIEEICTTWKRLAEQYGSESVAFFTGGGIRAGGLIYQRFAAIFEGTTCSSCDDFAVNYILPLVVGNTPLMSGNEPKAIQRAKTILIWGANPTESVVNQWHFVADAVDNGAHLVVIDPCYNTAASKAHEFVPIKPGTDAVLALAMTKYIIDQGMEDVTFLKTNTVAPFLVKESDGMYLRASDLSVDGSPDAFIVMGADGSIGTVEEIGDPVIAGVSEVSGIKVSTAYDLLLGALSEYTLEKAEEICGVPADVTRHLSEIVVEGAPTSILPQPGLDRYYNGHTGYFAIATLLMVAGQFGRAGAGLSYGYNEAWNVNWMGLAIPGSTYPKLKVPVMCIPEIVKKKEFAGMPVNIRSMFIIGKNIVANGMDRKGWIEAFNAMDLVVSAEMEMCDTSRYADIVLPIAHLFEYEDISVVGAPHSFDMFQDKCIDPLYECKTDFEAAKLIIEGMGQTLDQTYEEFLDYVLDTDFSKMTGVSYASLKEKKAMDIVPAAMRDEDGYLILGRGGSWRTSTGRAQFYLETVAPRLTTGVDFDREIERLPHWIPPFEASEDNALAEKYPFVCIQPHTKWRVHASFSHSEWLRELDPEPVAYLNPVDAESLGLPDGCIIRMYNDRGEVTLRLLFDAGVRPGTVSVPKGWQVEHYISGHYQDLTQNVFHPFCSNHIASDTRVAIELVD